MSITVANLLQNTLFLIKFKKILEIHSSFPILALCGMSAEEDNMHDLATISVIQDIRPIEGKDRIELATVENYNSIVQKGEYKAGDKVIYIYYDSILPVRPEFEFLRKRCWSEKYQGFRIRPMKMGNAVSEGLIMPLSILPEGDRLPVGTVVADKLAIRRYETEASAPVISQKKRWWMKYTIMRKLAKTLKIGERKAKGYPSLVPKSDEENIEKCWDKVSSMTDEFIITEKMEGSAAMYVLDRRRRLHSYSHNWEVGGTGSWGEIGKKLMIRERLIRVLKKTGKRIAIEGEICGPGIQKNIYGFPELRFFLYSAYEKDTGRRLSYAELCDIARIMDIEQVPFIRRGTLFQDIDTMLSDADGCSVFGKDQTPREGLVWRTEDGNVHFKCKSRSYKVWFGT